MKAHNILNLRFFLILAIKARIKKFNFYFVDHGGLPEKIVGQRLGFYCDMDEDNNKNYYLIDNGDNLERAIAQQTKKEICCVIKTINLEEISSDTLFLLLTSKKIKKDLFMERMSLNKMPDLIESLWEKQAINSNLIKIDYSNQNKNKL